MFKMKKHAQEHILKEVADWSINSVSIKRLHKAHDRAEAKKVGKRARQEISRARSLASQKQFQSQSKARQRAEAAKYTLSSKAAEKKANDTVENLK